MPSLSREAVVILRSPHETTGLGTGQHEGVDGNAGGHGWKAPTLSFLEGKWFISHSTLSFRPGQRNVRIVLRLSGDGKQYLSLRIHETAPNWATENTSGIATPLNLQGDTASDFNESESQHPRTWQVLAWGKEGQLESWMVEEGDGWIGDGSGERRPDWRNSYVVVYVTGEGKNGDESGVEVWDRWGGELSAGTIAKIREALNGVEVRGAVGTYAEKLVPVLLVDDRNN